MSFEGYYQYLCAKGHLNHSYDIYGPLDEILPDKCHCGEKIVWRNVVDETNGIDENYPQSIPYPLEIEEEEITEYCQCCGHTAIVSERRYRIPKLPEYKETK